MCSRFNLVFYSLFYAACLFSQADGHFESAVLAENNWRFLIGDKDIPPNWNQPGFDDSQWGQGPGGIGYGDGDDATKIPQSTSLFLRKEFLLFDTSVISEILLHADYDDGYVAYLNGVEIARRNIGVPNGPPPAFDELATKNIEALLYQGGLPEPLLFSAGQMNGIWKNGTNLLAVQVHNSSHNSSDMSASFFLSFKIPNGMNAYQPLPDWFTPGFEYSNLPLFFIKKYGSEEIPDEPKVGAHLYVVDNGPGTLNALLDEPSGYDGNIAIEIRGNSSQMYPKKNYGFETRLPNGENNNVPLLGLPAENDWVLHGPYGDKSLMRNVLAYHIGSKAGEYTPRTRWCELFLNYQYRGVYVLVEKIKRDVNRVDIDKLKPGDVAGDELTGGYIFQVDRDDPDLDDGFYSNFDHNVFYAFHDPRHDELAPQQKQYLSNYVSGFEETMNAPGFENSFEEYIDLTSFVDYVLAAEIFKSIDAYKLSFFMYKEKDSDGGKIHLGPLWDLDLAFGNFNFGQDPAPFGWTYDWAVESSSRPFWVPQLLTVASVRERFDCRWQELRQQGWSTDSLMAFIDENAALLDTAMERNFQRWKIMGEYVWPNDFVGESIEEEIGFLKTWLAERLEWMDENIGTLCPVEVNATSSLGEVSIVVSPNPFHDKVVFSMSKSGHEKIVANIYDAFGRKVGVVGLGGANEAVFSFGDDWHSGIYFYLVCMEDRVVTSGKLLRNR